MTTASTQKIAKDAQSSKRYGDRSTASSCTANSPASFRTCSCSSIALPPRSLRLLALLPAAAEPARGVVHVAAHRGAGGRGIVARDRRDDLAVLADGDAPERRRVEVVLEPQEERAGALRPERLHDEGERAVAARLGDA